MKWIDAKTALPEHQREVLICIDNSGFYLGYYDAVLRRFKSNAGKEFNSEQSDIHWALLIKP